MQATRESYLLQFIEEARPWFLANGICLPERLRASCSWPGGRSIQKVIGQCWSTTLSGDQTAEIFISPALEDPLRIGETLVHELIHAADDCRNGHRAPFRKMALALGLEGPMRATHAGPELKRRINDLSLELGPYPHAKILVLPEQGERRLLPDQPRFSGPRTQQGRLRKVTCVACSYAVWTTRVWLNKGTPTCACGNKMSAV